MSEAVPGGDRQGTRTCAQGSCHDHCALLRALASSTRKAKMRQVALECTSQPHKAESGCSARWQVEQHRDIDRTKGKDPLALVMDRPAEIVPLIPSPLPY